MARGSLVRLWLGGGPSGLLYRRRRVIHHVLKFFAGLEVGNLFGGHLDTRSGLGVASNARLPLARTETAKPTDFNLVTATQGFNDAVEDGLDDDLGLLAGHFHYARD